MRWIRLSILFLYVLSSSFQAAAESVKSMMDDALEFEEDGKGSEAEAIYRKILTQNSQNVEAQFQLATLLMNRSVENEDLELLKQAIHENEKVIQLFKGYGEAYDNLAYCFYILKDYKTSYDYLLKANRRGVRNPFLRERLRPYIVAGMGGRKKIKEKKLEQPQKTTAPIPSDDELGGGLVNS